MISELLLRAPAAPAGSFSQPPPRISVLIPAYNAAGTIGEALDSALGQTPPPFQTIVSDDGSQDDLDAALRPFRRHIRVVRGSNGGLAVARNRAAAVADGELLALLDADDVWLPGRVHALSAIAAARPDLAVLTTDAIVVRDGEADPQTYYATREFYIDDQRIGILRNSFIFGAGAIRRDAFRAAGGYRPGIRSAEDWDLWLRLLLGGCRAGLIEAPLYEYRRRADSLTGDKVELALGVLDVLRRARPLVGSRGERRRLAVTTQQWREIGARAAAREVDRRARGLAIRAALGGKSSIRARLEFAARATLPHRFVAAGKTVAGGAVESPPTYRAGEAGC